MPLTNLMLSAWREREFWSNYFFGDWLEGAPGNSEKEASLGFLLYQLDFTFRLSMMPYTLELHFSDLRHVSLELRHGRRPMEIAWDDMAHPHPHALRWPELELICRCAAIESESPVLAHPGIPLLLLYRFAPLCDGDDAEGIFKALESAWRSLGLFSQSDGERFARRFDCRGQGFAWHRGEGSRWTLRQDDGVHERTAYSLRADLPGRAEFPFEAFGAFIKQQQSFYLSSAEPAWLAWNGGEAAKIARSIAAEGDFERLPLLADALEAAGCQNLAVLAQCHRRESPLQGAWIVEWLLKMKLGALTSRCP